MRLSQMRWRTPVIYFYTPQVRRVEVEVGYPTGLWDTVVPAGVNGRPGSCKAARARNPRRQHSWTFTVTPPSMKHNDRRRPPATRCGTTRATSTRLRDGTARTG